MVSLLIQNGLITNPLTKPTNNKTIINTPLKKPINSCFQPQKPKFQTPFNLIKKILHPTLKYYLNSNDLPSKIVYFDEKNSIIENNTSKNKLIIELEKEEKVENEEEGKKVKKNSKEKMLILCGVGYWVQGFRCFPWLALNFHMANNLNFDPSTLQLVQYSSILPMVAKPLYGILFDAINIGGAGHRIPYVALGVLLQIVSWGPLAILPFVGDVLPTLMACVLLSNLGGAITEVAQDALVAEYGQKHKMVGLQSYTFMAIAIAGVVGNLVGGVLLSRTHPRTVLSIFSVLLLLQLLVTFLTKEESLGLSKPASSIVDKQDSLLSSVKRRFSELLTALSGEKISKPVIWAVGSIAMVPMLTGSIFCYQTQSLNLDPSIIGMSKVIGQMLLLSLTVLYDRFWKNMPFRQLMTRVQIFYAASLLLDFVLVKQINLRIGIPNDVYVLCFSGLAETAAIFKTVPFFVLIGSLCPPGCEAPVNAFLASALTLSTIGSGFSGIGLASILGISSENYSNLPFGIIFQFLVALVPLFWINNLPLAFPSFNKDKSKSRSKRIRRNRKKGRITLNKFFTYGRGKESEKQN